MTRSREDIIAAAFSAAGPGAAFDPIQLQHLLFLIDRTVSDRIGGPFFRFEPHDYGPYDGAIHGLIQEMGAGSTSDNASPPHLRYLLTDAGRERGEAVLGSLPESVSDYFGRAARWARLMPHRRMFAAMHREHPEIMVNCVVRHTPSRRPTRRLHPFIRGMMQAFDITGTMFRSPDSAVGLESPSEAIAKAWRRVGRDLEDAMVRLGESERLW